MNRACVRTIGPRTRISRHGGASARCNVSNRRDQLSASCPFTPPSKTLSTSSAISHPDARSASSGTKPSRRGELLPRPESELGLQIFARPNSVRVTRPLPAFARARTEPRRKHLAVPARQLALQPRLRKRRRHHRGRMRGLAKAHRPARNDHLHRKCAIGRTSVRFEGRWYNAGLPPDCRIEFRVGIHLGDVVEESDGDLMGDGVSIAARLEGICEPSGVCLSGAAHDQVRDRLKETFVDLGEKALKNIARPVRAYSIKLGAEGAALAPLTSARQKSDPRPSSCCPSLI